MSKLAIKDDATIADVAERLSTPVEYVRQVLENMWECKRHFGEPKVPIGLLGEGRAPNYRIEAAREADTPSDRGKLFGIYSGLSHKKIDDLSESDLNVILWGKDPEEPEPDRYLHYHSWSGHFMSLDEVSALLGKVRQKTRRKP